MEKNLPVAAVTSARGAGAAAPLVEQRATALRSQDGIGFRRTQGPADRGRSDALLTQLRFAVQTAEAGSAHAGDRVVAEAIVRLVLPEMANALTSELVLAVRSPARTSPGDCLATWALKHYGGVVRTVGGLKFALEAPARNDRRVRFANVSLSGTDVQDEVALVTDSQGRMSYRLPDGEYLLRVAEGHESRFTVRAGRWTSVRIRLP